MSAGSAVSSAEQRRAAGRRPIVLPRSLQKTVRLLLGLVVVALIWEGAVRLFGIRPSYLPRLSTILMSIAATPRAYIDGFLRTLAETLIGFVPGGGFGVLTGISSSSACVRYAR